MPGQMNGAVPIARLQVDTFFTSAGCCQRSAEHVARAFGAKLAPASGNLMLSLLITVFEYVCIGNAMSGNDATSARAQRRDRIVFVLI